MDIIAGMSGLKAAAELVRILRDGLKAGTIKPDEIAGRIGEIYDYIIDSKDALVDAKEELESAKRELTELKETRALAASLQHDGKVYWIARSEKWDGPFCAPCWDDRRKLVRLDHQRTGPASPNDAAFWCPVCLQSFTTRRRLMLVDDQPVGESRPPSGSRNWRSFSDE